MTSSTRRAPRNARRGMRAALSGAAAALVALSGALPLAAPASAADPKLSVSKSSFGANAKDVRVTVTGRNYLVPPHVEGAEVFGGVYAFFGWVKPGGKWGPSKRNSSNNNGTFGVTYHYPGEQGDAGTRDGGEGAIRFVSFTDGGISGAATPYHMDDSGGWTAQVTVPGPTYTYRDGSGTKHKVDCRKVTCGIYTIGAHGKASATNEVFTPVSFAAAQPTKTPEPTKSAEPSKSASPSTSKEPSKSPKPSTSASASPSPSVSPSVAVPSTSAPEVSVTPAAPVAESPSSTPLVAVPAASESDASTPVGLWFGLGALVLVAAGGLVWWLRRPTA